MTDAKDPKNVAAEGGSDLPEQQRVRREKRARLLSEGTEAYPVEVARTGSIREVRERYRVLGADEEKTGAEGVVELAPGEETDEVVSLVGRLMFMRNTGKLCFATLQEGDGTQIQAMLSLAEVGKDALDAWKADADLGDFISVTGRVVASRRGELSVMATAWQMASKALRPLPVSFAEMAEDTRVRHRYTDLIMREADRKSVV